MFDNLSRSLQRVGKSLRGHGRLTEANIKDAMRDVRMALLEADVNFKVAKDFTSRVREACLNEEVLDSITPGQQVIKRVHDELTVLLGGSRAELGLKGRPATIMMIGLHGAGKTTTTAKLARYYKSQDKNVLLVACDIRRPAAVDQLSILAQSIGVDVVKPAPGETVPALGLRALTQAEKEWRDLVIFDTGGRFQIDDELIGELKQLKQTVKCQHAVLVADAALGQESVSIAQSFNDAVGISGLILTKLDGDARGGAALSIHSVTGCPILWTGTGEKIEDLEAFHPERLASRILGMGDIISLVEKAEENMDIEKARSMEKKLRSNSFDFNDFLDQMQQLKKMGSFESIIGMLPGGNRMMDQLKEGMTPEASDAMGGFAKKSEAIIQSMTLQERRNPKVINARRRKRIAAGSGTHVADVNELIRNFQKTRKMMKKFGKMQKSLQRFK
jgi:signal recognition particle subunit SRP54